MTADEILELFCHPSFTALRAVSGGWTIEYGLRPTVLFNGTLDDLLCEYSNIIDQIDSIKGD